MAFDFKKEYKEFYMPKNKPEIVTVPQANYKVITNCSLSSEIRCLWGSILMKNALYFS